MARVAIVTGSATGLGAACAVDLAERGWNVAINYTKSKKEADETYAMVKARGVDAVVVQADMGKDADCRKLVAETLKKWGRIDGLINNAGTTTFQKQGDLDGFTDEDFDRMLWVNVAGPYMMSRAVWPTMKKQWEESKKCSSIVNISSTAAVTGVGSSIPYVASKGSAQYADADADAGAGAMVRSGCQGERGMSRLHSVALAPGRAGPGRVREDEGSNGANHGLAPGRHARADRRSRALFSHKRIQYYRRGFAGRCREPSRNPADEERLERSYLDGCISALFDAVGAFASSEVVRNQRYVAG